ncbi:MAG TPA: hypothetical protein VLA72_00725, partial [Anaerolineales bacterium]|nr:hypothetical protein [Anaerolineales bacterium]
YLMIVLGILVMLGSALNWRVISRSGKLLNMLLGDTVARIVYFIVGLIFVYLGLNQLTGFSLF